MEIHGLRSFRDVHRELEGRIGDFPGIGPLTVYDLALAIGAHLGFEPEAVYLHAGTAAGARALGLDTEAGTLSIDVLPPAFRKLRCYEVEDCLCIYEGDLRRIGGSPRPSGRDPIPPVGYTDTAIHL